MPFVELPGESDAIALALEHLYDADRATLLTEIFRRTVKVDFRTF